MHDEGCLHCVAVVPESVKVRPDPKYTYFQTHLEGLEAYDEASSQNFIEECKVKDCAVLFGMT